MRRGEPGECREHQLTNPVVPAGNGNRPTTEFRREAVRSALTLCWTRREIAEIPGIGLSALTRRRRQDRGQVPTPLSACAHCPGPPAASPLGEREAEPAPPVAHVLVADLDPAFGEGWLSGPQRERESDVAHERRVDDLAAGLATAERAIARPRQQACCRPRRIP